MSGSAPFGHDRFLSPFAWRYGSEEMRRLWSLETTRRLWRRVWVALARAQSRFGLVSAAEVADLEAHAADVDLEAAHALEREIRHDLMAELRVYASQCPVGGRILHLGATSMDIEDNAEALRLRQALDLLLEKLDRLLLALADRIEAEADRPCMGFTHLQPAEPTTVGYRLAQYAQDLLQDREDLARLRREVRGKGLKGAVGTAASYAALLTDREGDVEALEAAFLEELGLEAFPAATQVYPRKQEYRILTALASLAQSLYRFAFDLRLLQSPVWGEWREPFGPRQVGSSAMPFKRNPILAERTDSLARFLAALPRVAWDNAAHSHLERTLDDSANRRLILPEAFLAADALLEGGIRLVEGLTLEAGAIEATLERYGVFAATERLLMALVQAGADRQEMHERIREHALAAWAALSRGEPNPLADRLAADPEITRYLPPERVRALLDAREHLGAAPRWARRIAARVREVVGEGG